MGRPIKHLVLPKVAATIAERAGPIPVGRKFASLVFLRTRWQCAIEWTGFDWDVDLRPTCRVVYDDDTWLVADAFHYHETLGGHGALRYSRLYYRRGWEGNTPTGAWAWLSAVEWVNPYPGKTIKELRFFVPEVAGRMYGLAEAIVAITGIEPVEQDLAFWSNHPERPPFLPPLREPKTPGVELKTAGGNRLTGPGVDVKYTLKMSQGTKRWSDNRCLLRPWDGIFRSDEFGPFGVEQVFDKPVRLSRVEVLGPLMTSVESPRDPRAGRKVDVRVEFSRDGQTWQRAGELRGISGDADFLPLELPGDEIKAIRLTGDCPPLYRNFYVGPSGNKDYFPFLFTYQCVCPHFHWRLFAPVEGGEGKK